MAQTNYTPISLYYSATATNVPIAANLVPGELAINTADGKLYYEDSAGVVQVLATKSTGSIGGSNTQVQFNNSGSLGGSSSFTWDGTTVTATKFAGALNGTVGATTSAAGTFTSLSDSGNLTFTGTGNRITGDFSNATIASRVVFQSSTTNGNTGVFFIPNGTAVNANIQVVNNSDPTNASITQVVANSTESSLRASITGTGTYLPLTMYTNASERLRIDTSGNVGIGTSSPTQVLDVNGNVAITGTARRITGDFSNATIASRIAFQTSTANGATSITTIPNGTGTQSDMFVFNNSDTTNSGLLLLRISSSETTIRSAITGTGTYIPMTFYTNNAERLRIDTSGKVGIGTSSPGSNLAIGSSATGGSNLGVYLNRGSTTNFYEASDGTKTFIGGTDSGNTSTKVGSLSAHDLSIITDNTSRIYIVNSTGNVGIGTTSPNASAILDVQSTTKGVRMPNMTTTQKNAISTPAAGLMVFDTTLAKLCVYSGSAWQTITSI
jgi:hypothetical protein